MQAGAKLLRHQGLLHAFYFNQRFRTLAQHILVAPVGLNTSFQTRQVLVHFGQLRLIVGFSLCRQLGLQLAVGVFAPIAAQLTLELAAQTRRLRV